MPMGRWSRITVRVLAILGMATFGFMLVFVVADAAGRPGVHSAVTGTASAAARAGADALENSCTSWERSPHLPWDGPVLPA